MLIVLDATTKKLQAKIAGAPATTNPDFVAAYADDTGSAFTEGNQNGALNGSTVVDVVASPASATRRVVKSLSFFNCDTAAVVLTVYYNDNGTQRVLFSGSLAVGALWTTDMEHVIVADIASLSDIIAERSAVATLTNKTITSPSGLVKADVGLGSVDNTSDATKNAAAVTLTNKTITSPLGLVKADVGLGNVDNTSNATERAATATLTNKTLTSPVINTPTGIVKGDVGLGNVDNTSNATERAATATLTNKTLTSPVINTPTGIVKGDVGLGSVDNTSDAGKPVSTAQQTALDAKVAGPAAVVTDDVPVIWDGTTGRLVKQKTYAAFKTLLALVKGDVGLGNVDNTSNATERAATATLTNKTLTSPAITTPTGIVKGDVGLGNVDNTSNATERAATATLTNKTLTSPVINTPTGIVKGDVGLGNVDNTSNATERAATATLTNKRFTKRNGSTTSSATPTINTDNVDFYALTAQTADITSFTTNLSGTPVVGDTLWIAITGTAARAITWGTSFEASTVALPTTTVTTARLDVGFVWNDATSKWRCIATS